jgi:hypothetical protein
MAEVIQSAGVVMIVSLYLTGVATELGFIPFVGGTDASKLNAQ